MLKIDRRLLSHFDWPLLLLALMVIACGLITVTSASHQPGQLVSRIAMRQIFWAGAGLGLLLLMLSFDYHRLERYGYLAYGISVLLLALVPIIGTSGGGARRWLPLGPFAIQPSEFAKIGVVIALARYLHREVGERPLALRSVLFALLLYGIPAALVLKQPDLGTVIAIGMAAGAILLVAGLRMSWIIGVLATSAAAAPYLWSHLKPYQQRRILTFMDPDSDPLGAGYHVIQSKIAIGSGMVQGKGYMNGTQNRLNFLPEQHTDFIFSVFAEEWGFLGAMVLLGLYAALLVRCVIVASRARDSFGVLLAAGLTGGIFCQVIVNIGMATGSMPVVGITLPFLSYGGSSMLVCLMSIGMLMNISMRRFTF